MDKQALVHNIMDLLKAEAENFSHASKVAHADATNAESKAENKYDTRGLEASYLAGAQARMAAETEQSYIEYQSLQIQEFTNESRIALTAFVELESGEGKRSFYFLGPKAGGTELELDGIKVLIITPSSTLGGKLVGREVGDVVELNAGGLKKEYEIISLC